MTSEGQHPREPLQVEIGVQDVDGVRIALAEGADRIELCAALSTGGLTPSFGTVELALEAAREAGARQFVHVLVRPRPGGFVYTKEELDVVLHDIRMFRRMGAAGVVIGALDKNGYVDVEATRRCVQAAGDLEVTFHRAIDAATDPASAVDELVALGVNRILSSGQERRSLSGISALRALVSKASGRIEVMAGGGVRVGDIAALAQTGVDAVHLSARRTHPGTTSGPGGGASSYEVTDPATVQAAVAATRSVAA